MNKSEREELRRLLRSRFKLLRTDVKAREAELHIELEGQLGELFAGKQKAYDDALYRISLAVDDVNRQANDIARELYGADEWGTKVDRTMVSSNGLPNPFKTERQQAYRKGQQAIEERVRLALLELARQENELLTDLATTALDSAESKEFFNRIPSVSELVPAYRLKEISS